MSIWDKIRGTIAYPNEKHNASVEPRRSTPLRLREFRVQDERGIWRHFHMKDLGFVPLAGGYVSLFRIQPEGPLIASILPASMEIDVTGDDRIARDSAILRKHGLDISGRVEYIG